MSSTADRLVLETPHAQNEINLFAGEWAYDLPVPGTVSGTCSQFKHKHFAVCQLEAMYKSLRGWNVLELGPNEGEVSFHLHHAGCRRVLAIEARARGYLKCLVAKNLLDMFSVQFMLGDFVKHLETTTETYDLCMASGVLYHMPDPIKVIDLMCRRAHRIAIGSITFDQAILEYDPKQDESGLPPAKWKIRDPKGEPFRYGNFDTTYYKYDYECDQHFHEVFGHGGPAMWATLISKDEMIRALEHFGMRVLPNVYYDAKAWRGPHVNLIAERR